MLRNCLVNGASHKHFWCCCSSCCCCCCRVLRAPGGTCTLRPPPPPPPPISTFLARASLCHVKKSTKNFYGTCGKSRFISADVRFHQEFQQIPSSVDNNCTLEITTGLWSNIDLLLTWGLWRRRKKGFHQNHFTNCKGKQGSNFALCRGRPDARRRLRDQKCCSWKGICKITFQQLSMNKVPGKVDASEALNVYFRRSLLGIWMLALDVKGARKWVKTRP